MDSRVTDSDPDSPFRYLAICYPFKHKDFTGKIVTIAMIMTYIYGTIANSPGLLQVPLFQNIFFLEVMNFEHLHCI